MNTVNRTSGNSFRDRIVKQRREDYRKSRVLAIYDFAGLPYSFDICTFLINAELERRIKGCDKIDIAFVCHASTPSSSATSFVNKDNFRHYVHNLGLESTRLLGSVGSIFVFDNRKLFMDFFEKFEQDYLVFPRDYMSVVNSGPHGDWLYTMLLSWYRSIEAAAEKDPTLLDFCAPEEQVHLVRKWILKNIYPRIPITITLRECEFRAAVNNNIPEWQKLIDYYRDSNLMFIILRDYYKLYEYPILSGSNVVYYNEPVTVLSLRAALYQESSLNLFVPNGCTVLAIYNRRSRYLYFTGVCVGLTPGCNSFCTTAYQKIVHKSDNFETMKNHVDEMLGILQADNALTPCYYYDGSVASKQDALTTAFKTINDKYQKYLNNFSPDYLKDRIVPQVRQWVVQNKRVLIYGAGYHTDNLFHWTNISDAKIVGLSDKDPDKHGEKYHGHEVIPPERILDAEPDVILISSNYYQDEIYQALRPLEKKGIELVRIYR